MDQMLKSFFFAGLIDSETDLFDDDPDEEAGPEAAITAPGEGDTGEPFCGM